MAKTIVIFSVKGGVGKTLIASNLAVSLAKEQKKKVCLIDLDLQVVGDMARMLNLNPQKSMADLIYLLTKQPEAIRKEDFLIHNDLLGIDFLPAVLKPQQSPYVDPQKIKDVFNLLDKDYDYIVVDAGNNFCEVFLPTLGQANSIFLVLTPDILSIHQTRWALDTLQSLLFPLSLIKMIINRAESASSISWQEIKVSLPVEIIAQIPSEGRAVGDAVNRGIPVLIDSPRSKFSQTIQKFSTQLVNDENLFVPRHAIEDLQLKEIPLDKSRGFWKTQGLAQSPDEYMTVDDTSDKKVLLKRRIHNRLIDEMDLKRLDSRSLSDPKKMRELRSKAELTVTNLLTEEAGSFIADFGERTKLVKEILDEALALGPLEDLLADDTITDIMVNNKDDIYIERHGKIVLTDKKFITNEQVKTVIERIIAPIGRRIDESVPMVDARLTDGSRVNAIIPPLSLTGPTLTIRKFRKERLEVKDLVELKTLNSGMADFIKACVVSRKNMIVSGGTGSGKTTILNVLSSFIPSDERIVTIEDAAELKLHQEHWVRLESRPPNIEGKGAVTIRDIFRNTLRMRPDRIIIGECRGLESLDMLQAMNTGHDGSMTTIHANSTHDVLSRLDSMILMSGIELPIRAIREMIASAVDLIVHTARLSDGSRKILQVTELTGMKDEIHIGLQDVFIFKQTGIDEKGRVLGDFTATGYVPSFVDDFKTRGIPLPPDIFKVS